MEQTVCTLTNIPYGTRERQIVDIFLPQDTKCTRGLLLFIHGGGWQEGDKTAHHSDANYFCERGYICASMNYRYVSKELRVFEELDDITAALTRIKQFCEEHGIFTERVLLSGGSAGAHLAMLYAYTRKTEAPLEPVAVCAYCPPVSCAKADFLLGSSGQVENWKYEILSKCCGVALTKENFMASNQQEALKKISPEEYLTEDSVPTAVFHGKSDELVPLAHVEDFLCRLNSLGIRHDFLLYENSGHALDKDPDTAQLAKDIIQSYAEAYL